jgi:hypothetical protein
MPTKAAHLVAFFTVVLLSTALHRFVYLNLKRVLKRDFPKQAPALTRGARVLFILMDLPFAFIYFQKNIPWEATLLYRVILYPFSIWQAVMIMWSAILVPLSVIRRGRKVRVSGWWKKVREQSVAGSQPLMEPPLPANLRAEGPGGMPVTEVLQASQPEQR